jgi:hypothetical protein
MHATCLLRYQAGNTSSSMKPATSIQPTRCYHVQPPAPGVANTIRTCDHRARPYRRGDPVRNPRSGWGRHHCEPAPKSPRVTRSRRGHGDTRLHVLYWPPRSRAHRAHSPGCLARAGVEDWVEGWIEQLHQKRHPRCTCVARRPHPSPIRSDAVVSGYRLRTTPTSFVIESVMRHSALARYRSGVPSSDSRHYHANVRAPLLTPTLLFTQARRRLTRGQPPRRHFEPAGWQNRKKPDCFPSTAAPTARFIPSFQSPPPSAADHHYTRSAGRTR